MAQMRVKASVYRGGTSRGVFFHSDDLPKEKEEQHRIFLNVMDSVNNNQINGLGSGTSHTSKVVVMSPPTVESAHMNYTFYQIGIEHDHVDAHGTCGNLMGAVGAYVVDEGYVDIPEGATSVEVRVFNTNINRVIAMTVPVEDGEYAVVGDYDMAGVKQKGGRIEVKMMHPGGSKLGATMPLGPVHSLQVGNETYEVSVVDIVNPFVYVRAKDLGLTTERLLSDLREDRPLIEKLEQIRLAASIASGLTKTMEEALDSQTIPKIALVHEPITYTNSKGDVTNALDIIIYSKMVSMQKIHRTYAGSGLYNLSAAASLKGTIVEQLARPIEGELIPIGHPEGKAEVRLQMNASRDDVVYVGLDRTARRIMKGEVYVPNYS